MRNRIMKGGEALNAGKNGIVCEPVFNVLILHWDILKNRELYTYPYRSNENKSRQNKPEIESPNEKNYFYSHFQILKKNCMSWKDLERTAVSAILLLFWWY